MEIFLYTLSIMYSPGPVNFMGLNAGLTGQFNKTIGFFLGVGSSMLILFVIMGFVGEALISSAYLHYIALVGAVYTFYLAHKMIMTNIEVSAKKVEILSFWNGFWIQTLNPKALLVILPVTTIMYPSANITGGMILVVSILISIGASGAPCIYALTGMLLGKKIANKSWLNRLNRAMGMILIISGIFMLKDFLMGIKL